MSLPDTPDLNPSFDHAGATAAPPREAGKNGFDTLPLSPAMLANLHSLGYDSMTPIQAASLPLSLQGQDLIAQAKTGSGKTAAFALSLLNRLDASRLAVQAMVPHSGAGRSGHPRDPPPGPL